MGLHSYSQIFNVGHRILQGFFDAPVVVQEKVDGSQFSFGLGTDVELYCRSKGSALNLEAPEKMFAPGVDYVKSIKHLLVPGWTYRGEYLGRPKHNALVYDRVPKNNIILFDVDRGDQDYVDHACLESIAAGLDLEAVPIIYTGVVNVDMFRGFLERVSVLGGQKIEGVVCKPVTPVYGMDKKVLMAKFVSEAFKEVHTGEAWRAANPKQNDIVQILIGRLGTQARWQKAVQHLREAGQIEDSPRDIGRIMKEVQADVERECVDEIKDALYNWGKSHVLRGVAAGVPAYWKEELVKKQFETEPAATVSSDVN